MNLMSRYGLNCRQSHPDYRVVGERDHSRPGVENLIGFGTEYFTYMCLLLVHFWGCVAFGVSIMVDVEILATDRYVVIQIRYTVSGVIFSSLLHSPPYSNERASIDSSSGFWMADCIPIVAGSI